MITGKELKGMNKGIKYYVIINKKYECPEVNSDEKDFYSNVNGGFRFYDIPRLRIYTSDLDNINNNNLYEVEIQDDSMIFVKQFEFRANKYNIIKINKMNEFLF